MARLQPDGGGQGQWLRPWRRAGSPGQPGSGRDHAGSRHRRRSRTAREAGFACASDRASPLAGDEISEAIVARAEVLIWTLPSQNPDESAHGKNDQLRCHIKVDTGMRRLGLYLAIWWNSSTWSSWHPEVELAGVMTHFATADEEDDDFFRFQLHGFEDVAQTVLTTGHTPIFHAANSAATIRFPESHFNLACCGIAIYGLSLLPDRCRRRWLKPRPSPTSRLADIKELAEGDSVGYGPHLDGSPAHHYRHHPYRLR